MAQRERPVAPPEAYERAERDQPVDQRDEERDAAREDGERPAHRRRRRPHGRARPRRDGHVRPGPHPVRVEDVGGQARDDQHDRHRRGGGEVAHPDHLGVDLGREHVVASSDQDRIAEVGHAEDEDDERGRGEPRARERERHAAERRERPGAEVLGGLLERGVDVAEHVRQEDVGLREEREHLRGDDTCEAVDRPVEAEPARHHAVPSEEEDEGERDQERGRDQRHEAHERDEPLARDVRARHRVREHEGDAHRDHSRDQGHFEAVDQDPEEPPRAEELGVVGERGARRPRDARAEDAEHRPDDEQEQEEQHGGGRRRDGGVEPLERGSRDRDDRGPRCWRGAGRGVHGVGLPAIRP